MPFLGFFLLFRSLERGKGEKVLKRENAPRLFTILEPSKNSNLQYFDHLHENPPPPPAPPCASTPVRKNADPGGAAHEFEGIQAFLSAVKVVQTHTHTSQLPSPNPHPLVSPLAIVPFPHPTHPFGSPNGRPIPPIMHHQHST
jgi:hypothetical protein